MRRIIQFTTYLFICLGIMTLANASPALERWSTAESADVLYIPAPELPMVDIVIGLDAGAFRQGEQHGLAALTASMMTKGTQKQDEEHYLNSLENLGSAISFRSSSAQTIIALRSLTDGENLEASLALLKETIQAPRFEPATFERIRHQAIDAQKALLDNINAIASEKYYAALYPNHYLGTTSEMLKASLERLTLDDLKAFRDRYYRATGAKIVIVGAVTRSEAEAMAATISEALGSGISLEPIEDLITPVEATTIRQYYKSPQTRIMMGHPSINRFDEDFLPLLVGNHLFGGSGLTSQLMIEIREKQGLTYGIYSGFNPSFLHGPFTISLSTKNENVDHAIAETEKVLRQFIEEGPDEAALERAKNNLVGSMVLDLNSNAKIANAYLSLMRYDLPLDYFETFPEKVKALTSAEIQAAFKRHLNPDQMTVVIVGGNEIP